MKLYHAFFGFRSGERLIAQLLGDEQAPHDDDEPNGCIMMQNCAALLKRHADSLGEHVFASF